MASDREFINQNENKLCSEVMLKKVIVADEYASINQLAIIFLQEKLNAVPIINNKKEIVGIVTITDILKYVILNTEFLTRG
jgi:predicted transcriptional regulator